MAGTVFIPELWGRVFNFELRARLVGLGLVNENWTGDIKNAGDKVHVQRPVAVTVGSYSADTDITIQDADGTDTELDIDQSPYFALQVDDVYKVQSNLNLMRGFSEDAAYRMGKTVDAFILGQYTEAHSSNVIEKAAYTKDTIYAGIVAAAQNLDENDVPDDDDQRFLVLSPAEIGLIRNSSQFTAASELGDRVKQRGLVGEIAGFRVFKSTNLTTATDASSDSVRHCLYGHTSALTFAMQHSQIEMARMEKRFASLVKGLMLYGAKAFKPKALGDLRVTVA